MVVGARPSRGWRVGALLIGPEGVGSLEGVQAVGDELVGGNVVAHVSGPDGVDQQAVEQLS